MNKKLFLVMIIIVAAIIGLWSWTLIVPSNSISIGGSASVQPLLKNFTNSYKTEDKKKFVYSATGSGAGITNVKNEVYDIGFISKKINDKDWDNETPILENNELFKDGIAKWTKEEPNTYYNLLKENEIENDSYRAVELAKDSLVFIYNDKNTGFDTFLKNTGISFKFTLNNSNQIEGNGAYILKEIYENDNTKSLWTWRKLATYLAEKSTSDENEKNAIKKEAEKVSDIDIIPYSSTSGSGTRSSFTDLTLYKDDESPSGRGIVPGQAVKEYNSNGSIYNQIIKSPGSIGFVSMLYGTDISGTTKAIEIEQNGKTWNLNVNKQIENYPLTRPFICIFKYDLDNSDLHNIINFIYWMATSDESELAYNKLGLQQSVKTK